MKHELLGKEKFLIKVALLAWFADVIESEDLQGLYSDEEMSPIIEDTFSSQEGKVLSDMYENRTKLMLSDMFDLINKLK